MDYHYLLCSPIDAPSNTRKWEEVFADDHDLIVEDIDFSDKYLALVVREGRNFRLCSVRLPLPFGKGAVKVRKLEPQYLSLPKHVCQISPGPNYDFYSSVMRFIISSPVVCK